MSKYRASIDIFWGNVDAVLHSCVRPSASEAALRVILHGGDLHHGQNKLGGWRVSLEVRIRPLNPQTCRALLSSLFPAVGGEAPGRRPGGGRVVPSYGDWSGTRMLLHCCCHWMCNQWRRFWQFSLWRPGQLPGLVLFGTPGVRFSPEHLDRGLNPSRCSPAAQHFSRPVRLVLTNHFRNGRGRTGFGL